MGKIFCHNFVTEKAEKFSKKSGVSLKILFKTVKITEKEEKTLFNTRIIVYSSQSLLTKIKWEK